MGRSSLPSTTTSYVAHIDEVSDATAYAHTLAAYRRGDIRPGAVLLIARRFGEVEEAVVYSGPPVGAGSAVQIQLTSGLTLGQGEWGGVHIRRLRIRRRATCGTGNRQAFALVASLDGHLRGADARRTGHRPHRCPVTPASWPEPRGN